MAVARSPVALAAAIPGFEIRDVVRESGPRITYRARRTSGEQVVITTLAAEYPRTQDVAELRREFRLRQTLDVPGVHGAHELVAYGSGNVALVADAFGRSLAEELAAREPARLAVAEFFPVAIALARAVGALHEQRVIHKDITPRNVLVDAALGEVRLTEFGICSELTHERQSTKLSPRLEGSLPYISPEQTGRMSRDVDYRSDYYSMGVTLFELLTGSLPFHADEPLEWVHRHISQVPAAAHDVNREVPAGLSNVVSKLLAKNADERYQSTFGLIADLERCRDEFAATGTVVPFALGSADVSGRFRVPQALYGRERELSQLVGLFDDVAHGGSGFCVVAGYSGIGKSALVHEMGKSIAGRRGYLIEGKFDQFQQSTPYSAFAMATRGLVEELLGESPARLDAWRDAIRTALGANGRLMVDLVPELALIIGEQPAVADLPPTEAQNRFQFVFLNFVKVFATAEHPLVIFLDDLQWSDVPTLNLLARLATARELAHTLLIGAYRANAVDATHPLSLTLDQVRKARDVVELSLTPLDEDAVDRLTADTLHSAPTTTQPLSRPLHQKTQGNPFFIRSLLTTLHDQGAITFSANTGRWTWDTAAAVAAAVADNVVEFMAATLRRLPEPTQHVLQLAACIGNTFDLRTLAVIAERPDAEVAADLHPALAHLMVVPLTDAYKFVADSGGGPRGTSVTASYRFQHDRVQQAAYALIDDARKKSVHLSIGRLIRDHTPAAERASRVMDIVGHLNAGRELMHLDAERHELARLNLDAGTTAARSSAYESALAYLRVGVELAGDDAWVRDYELMSALARELQQSAYQTGTYADADAWVETILAHARTPLERVEILSARSRQYATMGRMRESIDAALAGLSVLGFTLKSDPTAEDVARELQRVTDNLAGRRIEDLVHEPEMADPQARAAARLLMEVFAAAFLSGSGNLFPYLILNGVNVGLTHGASPESAFNYGAYGMLLCGSLENPALGYEYGRLAVAMNERFGDLTLKCRIVYVYAMFIHHWSNHWATMTPWFMRGIEAGYQSGDMLYLAYSAQDCIIWDPTLDLATASQEQRKYLAIVKDCDYQDSYDSGTLFLQMQLNFQGLTRDRFSMNDAVFDEAQCVEGMRARRFMTGIANYHIYKAEIHALYGDYDGALPHVEEMDRLVASAMSLPQLVRYRVVGFLTRAALVGDMAEPERPAVVARLHVDRGYVARWAETCTDNFEHLRLLMDAELARIDGRPGEALVLYEQAIAAAHASKFLRDEAVANELAARCLRQLGVPRAGEGYLRAAFHLYERWGARRKVEQLEEQHPRLFAGPMNKTAEFAVPTADHAVVVESSALDMRSVIRASQKISGEIVVGELLRTTLEVVLENAGANRGCFVVREADALVVRAHADTTDSAPTLTLPHRLDAGDTAVVPLSIVNNVLRTGKPLVLADAADAGRFASDPYIIAQQPKSVMCVPIQRQRSFDGAIYLENTLTTGAFTTDRVEVIRLLAAQAAISLENARIYEDQVRLTRAQRRFVPGQFLEHLGRHDIADVALGEFVAREMSVLFADLRAFTPLAERLAPGEVIALLNEYFSRVGAPITDAGGFIDSYNGDEVMALFPMPADRAVDAGVGMARAVAAFNSESSRAGGPTLELGIGVNSGPLVLGTVGSEDRLKCGVVGDTVNTASRIEQLTKRYGARFLIGEYTLNNLREASRYSVRQVDRVAAKGKTNAIALYEVLDAESPARRAAKEATRPLLDRAWELYLARAFADAARTLSDAAALDPDDLALTVLHERALRYSATPPGAEWHGYEALAHK